MMISIPGLRPGVVTMRSDRPLCVAQCTSRGYHADDCPGGDCAGCVPRLAADGVNLCTWHLAKLGEDPVQLADLYDEIGLRLAGSGSAGEKTSGTPNRGIAIDERAVEMRSEIKEMLRSWAAMIAEERGWEPPDDEVRPIAEFVARDPSWLAAHGAAADASSEFRDLVRRAYSVAYPSGARRWQIKRDGQTVPCPESTEEGPCPGTLWALLRRTDSLLPSVLQCDVADEHSISASRWLTLGRELRRKEAA